MGLEKLQGQLSAFISTWTEDATASGAVATATHAAESNKSHYITGFSVSSYDGSAGAGTSTIEIKDDTDVILTIYKDNGVAADGGMLPIHSPAPSRSRRETPAVSPSIIVHLMTPTPRTCGASLPDGEE